MFNLRRRTNHFSVGDNTESYGLASSYNQAGFINKKTVINPDLPWNKTFDFTVNDGGFTAVTFPFLPTASGLYAPGIGWQPVDNQSNSGYKVRTIAVAKTFASREITSLSITYDLTLGIEYQFVLGAGIWIGLSCINQTQDINDATNGTNRTLTWTGSKTVTFINIMVDQHGDSSPQQGSGLLKKVVFRGNGGSPF